jgi:hypothetical protein
MTMQFSTTARNAMGDGITSTLGTSGTMKIYSGTPPTNPGTALSGNTLLSTLALSATFAPATSGGVITANAISNDTNAAATGTASFFRLYKSDGTTCVAQGSVGTSGTDAIIASTSIVATQTVSCSALTLTMPGA